MDKTTLKLRFPRKFDAANWAMYVIKLFNLAYQEYGPKEWAITQEKIGNNLYYRTELEFERDTPFQESLRAHGSYEDKISLIIEPFSLKPKKLNLDVILKKISSVAIFTTFRFDFLGENNETLTNKYKDTGKLLIPIEFWDIKQVNRKIGRGNLKSLDKLIVGKMHEIILPISWM
jgi:hypothetical protein